MQQEAEDLKHQMDQKNEQLKAYEAEMCEYEALQHREILQGKEILKYITRVQLLGAENAELKVELPLSTYQVYSVFHILLV